MFKQSQIYKVVLTGGGSGGHVFPLISVLRNLKKISSEKNLLLEVYYIGPNDFAIDYFNREGVKTIPILTGKLRRSLAVSDVLNNIFDFFKTCLGILKTFVYMFLIMPDIVFSKGGYGSFPVVLVSTIFFIPFIIHESDSEAGLVNHLMGRFAKKIFISFKETEKYFNPLKTELVGNPIREEIFYKEEVDKMNLRKYLGFDAKRPIISVLGGSLGAQHINDLILDSLPKLISELEIIHQTGALDFERVKREADVVFREIIGSEENKKYYHLLPFIGEESTKENLITLKDVYMLSDLIVARAGSGLIFEIAYSGKPSILIPIPWASREHQKKNAYEYSQNRACYVLEEKNLKPNIFTDLVFQIIKDPKKKEEMAKKAKEFSKPEAGKRIALEIINYLSKF